VRPWYSAPPSRNFYLYSGTASYTSTDCPDFCISREVKRFSGKAILPDGAEADFLFPSFALQEEHESALARVERELRRHLISEIRHARQVSPQIMPDGWREGEKWINNRLIQIFCNETVGTWWCKFDEPLQ
jgi:hypothetical protein